MESALSSWSTASIWCQSNVGKVSARLTTLHMAKPTAQYSANISTKIGHRSKIDDPNLPAYIPVFGFRMSTAIPATSITGRNTHPSLTNGTFGAMLIGKLSWVCSLSELVMFWTSGFSSLNITTVLSRAWHTPHAWVIISANSWGNSPAGVVPFPMTLSLKLVIRGGDWTQWTKNLLGQRQVSEENREQNLWLDSSEQFRFLRHYTNDKTTVSIGSPLPGASISVVPFSQSFPISFYF